MDSYYTKDYEKTKKNITKVREVREVKFSNFPICESCRYLYMK